MVDLAGSERANSTGATGVRLKEGANINKSLTTLGKVIAGLAEQASNSDKKSSKKKEAFIPFRDSVLTWLLKDSLGGNSKTCMIAAISPADYDETLSTLRYADQAKKIKTKAVVNEDPNAKMMRELKDEVEALRQALMVYAPEQVEQIAANAHPVKGSKSATKITLPAAPAKLPPILSNSQSTIVFADASGNMTQLTKEEVVEQLQMSEKLLSDLNQTWEEKLQQTEKVHIEREKSLTNLGITIEKNQVGLYTPKEIPYLINLNEDPLMSECLMYNIKPGLTFVDQFLVDTDLKEREDGNNSIRLSGSNINKDHCYFENKDNIVTLYPRLGCTTMVNGMRVSEPRRLKSGYRIIIGDHHVFRFNNPGEALKERELLNDMQRSDSPLTPPSPTASDGETATTILPPSTPGAEIMDWNFARREAMLNTYINDSSFDNFTNEDLDKLFDDVARIRIIRKRQSSSSDTLSQRTSTSSFARRSFYSTTPSSASYLDDAFSATTSTDESSVASTSSSCSFILNAKDEQQLQSDHHRRKSEAKLRRLSRESSLSSREKYLAEKTIRHWKKQRKVNMAKTILTYDTYLAQANALSVKYQKDVFYQFAVVHDHVSAMAVSHWETTSSGLQPKSTLDPDLIKSPKPCIAVQVIDKKHQAMYVWSIEKFMARLRYLQGAYFASDSKKHIKGDDMYYEPSVPSYMLMGVAKVPLRNLMTQVPVESTWTVHNNTDDTMGQLTVSISPVARSIRYLYRGDKQYMIKDEEEDEKSRTKLLHVGQQLVFEISILRMTGMQADDFSQVHAQFRLSTFGSQFDGVLATNLATIAGGVAVAEFNYHQTLSMAITEELLNIIETKDIVFEVYGQPSMKYLERMQSLSKPSHARSTVPILPSKQPDDVMARIQICEITSDGGYMPVPVESSSFTDVLGQYDVFSLQQGQQRRIVLSLVSSATLENISDVRVGQIRLVDNKHRTIESMCSGNDIALSLIPTATDSHPGVVVHASWDSSLHDTILLNAITTKQQKVALTLSWSAQQRFLLNGTEVTSRLRFEKDIYVHIKDQNRATTLKRKTSTMKRSSSSLLNFFAMKPSNIKTQVVALYSIEYRPELVGGIQDLPLMELPAGILREEQWIWRERQEQVEDARYRAYLTEQLYSKKNLSRWSAQAIIDVWQKKHVVAALPPMNTKPASVHRWVPQVQQIVIPAQQSVKKGYLMKKNDSGWDKVWCVLTG